MQTDTQMQTDTHRRMDENYEQEEGDQVDDAAAANIDDEYNADDDEYNVGDNDDDNVNEACTKFLVTFLRGVTDAKDQCEGITNAYTAAGTSRHVMSCHVTYMSLFGVLCLFLCIAVPCTPLIHSLYAH